MGQADWSGEISYYLDINIAYGIHEKGDAISPLQKNKKGDFYNVRKDKLILINKEINSMPLRHKTCQSLD